jgi:hypothetical protein
MSSVKTGAEPEEKTIVKNKQTLSPNGAFFVDRGGAGAHARMRHAQRFG